MTSSNRGVSSLQLDRDRVNAYVREPKERPVGVRLSIDVLSDAPRFGDVCSGSVRLPPACCHDRPGKVAISANRRYRPSKKIDIGWHQFILNTRDYAKFCERLAGRFLHHVPEKFAAPSREGTAVADTVKPTVDAIEAAGLPIHKELWFAEAGKCTQCHAGCTSCGQEDQP